MWEYIFLKETAWICNVDDRDNLTMRAMANLDRERETCCEESHYIEIGDKCRSSEGYYTEIIPQESNVYLELEKGEQPDVDTEPKS